MNRESHDRARILIDRLAERGVAISVYGDQLRINAPSGVIDNAVADAIRADREAIIEIVAARGHPSTARIPAASRDGELPLGFVQQRMWSHEQLIPETVLYQLPAAWRLCGPLDVGAFRRAMQRFVDRHEILRTRFTVNDGAPMQRFAPVAHVTLACEDLETAYSDELLRNVELRRRIHALRDAPMKIAEGEIFRTRLFRLGPDEHVFFFMPHHLVWDGWSFDVFLRDMKAFYEAETAGAPAPAPLTLQYADYAAWHRDWLNSAFLARELDFWLEALDDGPPPLDLPTDRRRPDLFDHAGDRITFELAAPTVSLIRRLAQENRASTFHVMLAAWTAFVARLSGQRDIIVGAPVQARHQPALADLVGCFVNTLCLRGRVDPEQSFASLVRDTRDFVLRAWERQDAPIDLLAERLNVQRDPSRTPLFQTLFTHQHVASRPHAFGDVCLDQYYINPGASPTELMLGVMEGEETAHAEIIFATALFSRSLVKHFAECFQVFLNAALHGPETPVDELQILGEDERQFLLDTLNDTDTHYSRDRTTLDCFRDMARASPNAPAATIRGETICYGDLALRAEAFAAAFTAEGLCPGDVAAVLLDRGADVLAAILGVWRCGAAYLPLDPAFPLDRLRYMLEDSGARIVVCGEATESLLSDVAPPRVRVEECAGAAADCELPDSVADGRAYVIYTSGSTGEPKGVENSHRALMNFLSSMAKTPGLRSGDKLLAVTTVSFDISILELLLPLFVGAEVVIADEDDVLDGALLASLLVESGATAMQATPATWRLLLDAGWEGYSGLRALCGGEPLPADLAAELLPRVGELWNMYGPTETTIWSTCARITDADIHIGAPIANTQLYILDAAMYPVPRSVAGELWIGGEGVAVGYLGKPALTSERFVPNPFRPGERVYRSGDWARRRIDGAVEVLGRRDDQVKLRGYRIELGEIETALSAFPGVSRAAAAVHTDTDGEALLAGYIVPEAGEAPTGSELRRWLRKSLPQYMIPQFFITLDALPLTANRKVDRRALPPPAGLRAEAPGAVAPRTEREKAIAEVWREILGVETISITDNFFELGGQSLQVARMAARVKNRLGLVIAPRAVIFESLEQLAAGAAVENAA